MVLWASSNGIGLTTACSIHTALPCTGSHAAHAAAPSMTSVQAGRLLSWLICGCMPEHKYSPAHQLSCSYLPVSHHSRVDVLRFASRQTTSGAILGPSSTGCRVTVNTSRQSSTNQLMPRCCLPAAGLEHGSSITHPHGQAGGCGSGHGLFGGVGSGRVGPAG